MLLATALTTGLRQKKPDARLELVCTAANAGALPLVPGPDSCHVGNITRPDEIIAHMREKRYDILFDLSQWARIGAIICAASGAGLTVGFRTHGQFRGLPYDMTASHLATCHEHENFLNLGRAVWPDLRGWPQLRTRPWQKPKSGVVYCHLWPANGKCRLLKQWPPELWAETMDRLRRAGFRIMLTGSRSNYGENQRFLAQYFPERGGMENIAGKTSVAGLARLFTRASAVISVNTGIMHLAALCGAPTIGLHGPTSPRRWGPIGPRVRALLPDAGRNAYLNLGFEYPKNAEWNMKRLPVEKVMAALGELGALQI